MRCCITGCHRRCEVRRWCAVHWVVVTEARQVVYPPLRLKPRCFVPSCDRRSDVGGMCRRHYLQAHAGQPFTAPCEGVLWGIPGCCGKPHPLVEPPDPPLPAGLVDICTKILAAPPVS